MANLRIVTNASWQTLYCRRLKVGRETGKRPGGIGSGSCRKLLGGSTVSGFVRFMYDITQPLVAPFHGIFNTSVQGRSILEPESLVAIAIYSLIGWGIVSLIGLMGRTRHTEAA